MRDAIVFEMKKNKPKYNIEHLDGFKLIIDSKFNERKEKCEKIKDIILYCAESTVPKHQRTPKRPWITSEILEMMSERRK